jgi:F-type H+-transporting ATPase subunit epsilon
MATFHLDLVAPEKMLFSGDVQSVVVPGTEGLFQVFNGHSPMMSALKSGVVIIVNGQGTTSRLYVRGGFADVSSTGLTILAEHAVPLADVNAEQISQQIKDAQDDVKDAQSDKVRQAAQEKLEELIDIRNALVN